MEIFRDAARGTGPSAYDPAQVAVWAAYPPDLEAFRRTLGEGLTVIAELNREPAAFGQLNPGDHVAFLYTASRFNRRGCGTALYGVLEARAREQSVPRLTTNASRISRPFFEKVGFHVVLPEVVERGGVRFERFRMEKALGVPPAGEPRPIA